MATEVDLLVINMRIVVLSAVLTKILPLHQGLCWQRYQTYGK